VTASQPLRVCQVVASINRDVGGPAVSVPALAVALAARDVKVSLATLDYSRHGTQTPAPGVELLSLPAPWLTQRWRGWNLPLQRKLFEIAQLTDIVHNHGLWMWPNFYARQAAQRAGKPLVISPRGMVEQWSLGRSRAIKFLAWQAFEKENLRAAKMFHATSAAELASLRRLGLRQPVAVIPNGVELPDLAAQPPRTVLENKFPELAGKQWLLFLARLHPKKGVAELLRVWQKLAPQFPRWQLVLAGPDLDGHGEKFRRAAQEMKLAERVTFTGQLDGAEKSAALANAELFVLPTHSENFGLAIAEALAHRVPVITTTGAPWRELATENCGWWIEPNETALATSLSEALQLPLAARREMGMRGRMLVEKKYSWSMAAEQMESAYRWLLNSGSPPDCVHTA
jgi:glycosyltransferase involved in cell wall biosynthesis